MLFLPLEITGGFASHEVSFRDPVMWTGFGLAALFNGINILHAFFRFSGIAAPCSPANRRSTLATSTRSTSLLRSRSGAFLPDVRRSHGAGVVSVHEAGE